MKTLLIFICLFLYSPLIRAQFLIEGHVTDDKGSPVAGANIILSKTSAATVANYDGYFKLPIEGVQGKVILSITFIGYQQAEAEITLEENYNYHVTATLLKKKRHGKSSEITVEKTPINK